MTYAKVLSKHLLGENDRRTEELSGKVASRI
jgi:hypothetical protein